MMPASLDRLRLHAAYVEGLTPETVVTEVFARIENARDPGIFTSLASRDAVLDAARALPSFDPVRYPLWGLPCAIKDNIDVAGFATTAACPAFAYQPHANATAVGRLIDAGALVIGKTNLDQFATGLVGVRTPYPVPRNRSRLQRYPSRPFSEASRPAQSGVRTFDMSTDDAVVWCGMTRAELGAAYNNSAAVANSAEKVTEWTARTAALRAAHPDLLDLAYGPRLRNRIDVFRCGDPDAPLFVFIHGGYWQRNSKEVHGCMATGPLARGFDVAMIGYTLAPEVTLAKIVAETYDAIRWLRREGENHGIGQGKLIISGWSAGGHLAAMAMFSRRSTQVSPSAAFMMLSLVA